MHQIPRLLILLLFALSMTPGLRANEGMVFFENKIRPILVKHCYECHSEEADKRKGGLWLDRKEGWQLGGDSGASLQPGQPGESLLVHTVRYEDPMLQMPPKYRLEAEEVALLERWIAIGAPDPRDATMASVQEEIDYEKARDYWAFRTPEPGPLPEVDKTSWVRNEVDHYILSRLEQENSDPAADAAPADLIRRVHYALTGLPPTAEEIAEYTDDPTPERFNQVVDDLLNRPTYGEKWGRHWLDVARYSDSNGGDRNFTYHQAWRYRNYVIDSFNQDESYYQFVKEQIAGDLLPWETSEQRTRQMTAASFLALGPKMLTERDKEKLFLDVADEQVDTLGRGLLGLTMGCARCHDHKFDPISQEDYFALTGIFRSTEVVTGTRNGCVNVAAWVEQPLPIPGPEGQKLVEEVERMEMIMRLTVERTYMKKAGGKMSIDKLPFAGVLIDEADAQLIGEWKESTLFPNRFGERYVHNDQQGKGEKKAIFTASLPESGEYEVRIAYNGGNTRASNVPVNVKAWRSSHDLVLDQSQSPEIGGLFQPIGQFRFEKGGDAIVTIHTGDTSGFVIVDGVQFIPVRDIPRESMALDMSGGEDPVFAMSDGDLKKELSRVIKELRDDELVMAPREARDAGDIHLRVRGETSQLGPIVKRDFPRALHTGPAPEIPDGSSGRLELAEWISGPENPLLDRVMVNRIWHHLFGRGIVGTVDNFGALGDAPTHPELLDWLAVEFRQQDGSVKEMIRLLVTSRTWQLSADSNPDLETADPANQWFGRQNRRRQSTEEFRDSLLVMSGDLDSVPARATSLSYGEDLDEKMDFGKQKIRSVYLPVARNNMAHDLAIFDPANPDLVSGSRPLTTVPTQALFLMNSSFVQDQAGRIAQKVASMTPQRHEQVAALYRLILGRDPEPEESQRALAFVQEISAETNSPLTQFTHVLLSSTDFLFID